MNDAPRLVVFDCDGTLVDSQHMIVAAMDAAFDAHGVQRAAANDTRRVVGLSLPQAVGTLLPEESPDRHHAIAESYKEAFRTLRTSPSADQEVLYSGAREAIEMLDRAGYLLGVATGKSRRGLDAVIERFSLGRFFVTLQTADNNPSKPHPAMLQAAIAEAGGIAQQTLVVGDTSYDMLMAKAAGARGIGVDWGYHSPHELEAAGSAQVVGGFADLPGLVDKLFGHEA